MRRRGKQALTLLDNDALDVTRHRRGDCALHLHGAQDTDRVALLDLLTLLDAHLNNNTAHGRTQASRVVRRLLAGYGLDGRVLVLDGDGANLAVNLEPDVALSLAFNDRADSHEADDEHLALLDRDLHLLADVGAREEVAGGHDGEVTVLLEEGLVLLEDLDIEDQQVILT